MHSQEKDWRLFIWLIALFMPLGLDILLLGGLALLALFLPAETTTLFSETAWSSPAPYLTLLFPWPVFALFLTFALPWRHRERLRARAMAGDVTAMRPAIAQPKQQLATVTTSEPVVLRWKKWGKASSVTATSTGVTGHRAPRKDVTLAWDDIKLIEIWEATNNAAGYCLYAGNARFIEWPNHARFGLRFIEPAPELINQRQDALLGLACAHTGLPIRTLAPELAQPDDMSKPRSAVRAFLANALNAFGYMFLAVSIIGLLALIVLLPLTHSPLLNLYAFGVAAIVMVSPLYTMLRDARTPTAQPPVNLPLPPVLVPRDAVIAIKIPITRNDLLRGFLLGVLPISAIVPTVVAFLEFRATPMMSELMAMLHWILLFFIVCIVFIGLGMIALLAAPYLSGAHIIEADSSGVRQGRGKQQQCILWQDIADFVITDAFPDGGASFGVTSATQAIGWPADARWAEPPAGMAGDAGDAGDAGAQFAAIVAQRVGVQPKGRWE